MAVSRGDGDDGAARRTADGDLNAAATRGIWLGLRVTDRDFRIVDGVTGRQVARA